MKIEIFLKTKSSVYFGTRKIIAPVGIIFINMFKIKLYLVITLFFTTLTNRNYEPNGLLNQFQIYEFINKSPVIAIKTKQIGGEKSILIKNKFNEYILDSINNIRSYECIYFIGKPNNKDRNFICIKGKKYIIDELVFGKNPPSNFTLATAFRNVETFDFNKVHFIALFGINTRDLSSASNETIVLIKIINNEPCKILLVDVQACSSILCFGDFNKDGKLDYMQWGVDKYFKDKILIYTLNNLTNKFELNGDSFIKVTESDDMGLFRIDKSNSKFTW